MKQIHALVVAEDADNPGDPLYRLECPGVTDDCRAYEDCVADADEVAALDRAADDGDDTPTAHGVEHRHIDGMWMAATDHCLYATHPLLPDCGEYLTTTPGRYEVTCHYIGDGDIELLLSPVHACPPSGSNTMPCCGKTILSAATTDRITIHPELVTCNRG